MKAAGIGVGISAVVGAVLGGGAGDFLMGALAGAALSLPGIIFGGLVYRGCRYCLGDEAPRIIPAVVSGILAVMLMYAYLAFEAAAHPNDAYGAIPVELLIVAIIPVFATIYGSGVGQLSPPDDQ